MKWQIPALAFAALLLFGCTAPQQQGSNAPASSELTAYENELSSYDSEFTEIDQMLNDPELENIEFVELEESAFK